MSTEQQAGDSAPDPDTARGRNARHPTEIPAPGWRDILLRVAHRISEDNVTLVAGGIAFNVMFAPIISRNGAAISR